MPIEISGMSDYEERGIVSSSYLANLLEKALMFEHDQGTSVQFTDWGLVVQLFGTYSPTRIAIKFLEPVDDEAEDPKTICWACQCGEHDGCGRWGSPGRITQRIDDEACEDLGECQCDHATFKPTWKRPEHDIEQQSDGYRLLRPHHSTTEEVEDAAE